MTTFKQFLENKEDKTFYHVTTKHNWNLIKKQGLIPKIGERAEKIPEDKPKIYMFTDINSMEDALQNWLLDEFPEDEPLVVLKIKLPPSHPIQINGSEVTSNSPIPKEYIQKTNINLD